MSLSWFDRAIISIAPGWGLRRVQNRAAALAAARHYEAAQAGRRTSGWRRNGANPVTATPTELAALRALSHDLHRNNGWARRGVKAIVNNVVGWGIKPTPSDRSRSRSSAAIAAWDAWAESVSCDYDGRLNFYGLQRLAMEAVVLSGEAFVLLQYATTSDALAIPIRLQVLEADYLDTTRNEKRRDGSLVEHGIEFDSMGRRTAYWLYTSHPASAISVRESNRVPADRVLHIYNIERPGQRRGVPWLASSVLKINDLDDYEDAELMKQKVAACFAAFVTDTDPGATIGKPDEQEPIDHMEPGQIEYLAPGKTVQFAQPPSVQDAAFSTRVLRRIAAGLGVTYEDLTGDYSNVNFSSARMARIAHWQNVHVWRWDMLIPSFCDGVWAWAMKAASLSTGWPTLPGAKWAPPPMPVLDPTQEGQAFQRNVRNGMVTWAQAISEQGLDPIAQLDEIKRFNDEMDKRGVILDCDPRKLNASGGVQSAGGSGGQLAKSSADDNASEPNSSDANQPTEPQPEPDSKAPDSKAEDKDVHPKKESPKASPNTPAAPAEPKVFAYHQPYMKVSEIREGIGLDGNVEDGDLFANEFLAKHSPRADGESPQGS